MSTGWPDKAKKKSALDTRAFQGMTYFVRMPYTGQSVEAVSYTHLTLPTIYSV